MEDVSKLISETEKKICDAINTSNLHPAVVLLILKNITAQLQGLAAQMTTIESVNTEEKDDATGYT